jgi:hypothetical protein
MKPLAGAIVTADPLAFLGEKKSGPRFNGKRRVQVQAAGFRALSGPMQRRDAVVWFRRLVAVAHVLGTGSVVHRRTRVRPTARIGGPMKMPMKPKATMPPNTPSVIRSKGKLLLRLMR